jgi:hypothetical protein
VLVENNFSIEGAYCNVCRWEGEQGNSSVAQSKTSVLMEGWGRFAVKTREKGGIISSIRKNS